MTAVNPGQRDAFPEEQHVTKVIGWVLVLVLAVTTGVTATVISAPSARAATTYVQRGSGFVALNPVRVVDTRIGTGRRRDPSARAGPSTSRSWAGPGCPRPASGRWP